MNKSLQFSGKLDDGNSLVNEDVEKARRDPTNWTFNWFKKSKENRTANIEGIISGETTFESEALRVNNLDSLRRTAGLEELINFASQNADQERVVWVNDILREVK